MTYRQDVQVRNKNATQTEKAREDQIKNHAGGFVFGLDKWKALERFLILGTAGGTYYASQSKATKENLQQIKDCIAENAAKTIDLAVEISDSGRAVKNEPAILVLALCLSDGNEKAHAVKAVPKICRTGTHILTLTDYLDGLRGWGRVAKKALRQWLYSKATADLAYQAIKYKQRNGWSLRDLLRLSHPPLPDSLSRRAVLEYIVHPEKINDNAVGAIEGERQAKRTDPENLASVIREYNLPREAIPTEHLNRLDVWAALLEKMPLTALIRNLGKMSSIGLIKPMSATAQDVAKRLTADSLLKKARIHPLSLLIAYAQYRRGEGLKGSLSWAPAQEIVDALEEAYYKAFSFVEPTGKRYYLALDVSGSMGYSMANSPITCAQAAACMASVTHSVEPYTYVAGFYSGGEKATTWSAPCAMKPIPMKKESLGAGIVIPAFGPTDCAKPMLDAMEKNIEVDCFCIYTDNETWRGEIHPYKALQQYRQKTGIPATLVVVGMTATNFTIADPHDGGMLDVVGFDTSTPQAIAAFNQGG